MTWPSFEHRPLFFIPFLFIAQKTVVFIVYLGHRKYVRRALQLPTTATKVTGIRIRCIPENIKRKPKGTSNFQWFNNKKLSLADIQQTQQIRSQQMFVLANNLRPEQILNLTCTLFQKLLGSNEATIRKFLGLPLISILSFILILRNQWHQQLLMDRKHNNAQHRPLPEASKRASTCRKRQYY